MRRELIPKELLKGRGSVGKFIKGGIYLTEEDEFTNKYWLVKPEFGFPFFFFSARYDGYFNGRMGSSKEVWDRVKRRRAEYRDLVFWGTSKESFIFEDSEGKKYAIDKEFCRWLLRIVPDMRLKGVDERRPVLILSGRKVAGLVMCRVYDREVDVQKYDGRGQK